MREDFTDEVKRAVSARVGTVCSNPDCRAPTSGPQDDSAKALNVVVAAHITGAAPGGPRNDPSVSSDARQHVDNAIWLCQHCAKQVARTCHLGPRLFVVNSGRTVPMHRGAIRQTACVSPTDGPETR